MVYLNKNTLPQLQDFFWGCTRRIKNAVGQVFAMMSKFLGYRKNKSCNKRLEVFHKVGLQVEGCSSMHIDYWKWKYLLCLACYIFIALSKFWNFIPNDRNCPILDKYDNKIIRFRLYYFHLLPKRGALSPRLPIYFKYNNHIHSKNLGLEDWKKIDMMVS